MNWKYLSIALCLGCTVLGSTAFASGLKPIPHGMVNKNIALLDVDMRALYAGPDAPQVGESLKADGFGDVSVAQIIVHSKGQIYYGFVSDGIVTPAALIKLGVDQDTLIAKTKLAPKNYRNYVLNTVAQIINEGGDKTPIAGFSPGGESINLDGPFTTVFPRVYKVVEPLTEKGGVYSGVLSVESEEDGWTYQTNLYVRLYADNRGEVHVRILAVLDEESDIILNAVSKKVL